MEINNWLFKPEELDKIYETSQNPEEERLFRTETVSFIFAVCKQFQL